MNFKSKDLFKKNQLMKLKITLTLLIVLNLFSSDLKSCTISPSFSYSLKISCGVPYVVNINNTSTGTINNKSKFWLKINGVSEDTMIDFDSITILLKKIGSNQIKLFVKDSLGCIDSSTASSITVNSNAKSIIDQNFSNTYSPIWINCVTFNTDPDTFTVNFKSNDTLKKLKIIWGDGSFDTSGNDLLPNTVKSHFYNGSGTFNIKFITKNGNCTDTVYGKFINQRTPIAGIIGPPSGGNRGCVPHLLTIANNSDNISDLTKFLIEWGDGDSLELGAESAKDTLQHIYRTGICGGLIKITAKNVCGSSFTTWNPIDISDRDKARWEVTPTCDPTKDHVFKNLSADKYCLTPDIKEYFWDFGDGTTFGWTFSKGDQVKRYAKEGDYVVKLIVKNSCGYDTFENIVSVFYNPIAAFKFYKIRGCRPLAVNLVDTSKGRGIQRRWEIKEGSNTQTSTDSILNYTFTTAGTHTIKLTVQNKCASSSLTRTFIVTDIPKAQFTSSNSGCKPLNVSFTNTSTSYFNNPNYQWSFGDNTFSNLKNPPQKTYTQAGNYTIKLLVSDSCGKDSFSKTITVYDLPKAIFSGDTSGCTFDSLRFVNNSTNSNQFTWNMGNNVTINTNNLNDLKYAYSNYGTYTIRLIAGTSNGCKDTSYQNIRIKPGALADFSINKKYDCAPATFKITNNSLLANAYKWYSNGNLISQNKDISDILLNNDSSVIRLKLVVTSASSCQNDSMEKSFFTALNPIAEILNKDSGCGPLSVSLVNNSQNISTSQWFNSKQTIFSTLKNPNFTFVGSNKQDSLHHIKLKVKNWLGCSDSASTQIKVFAKPSANFDLDKIEGCGPLNINFTNYSLTNNHLNFSSLSHVWSFNNNTAPTTNLNATFIESSSVDSIHFIKLNVVSVNGCKDSIIKSITVFPKPVVAFDIEKDAACYELKTNLFNKTKAQGSANNNLSTYKWILENGQTANSSDYITDFKSSIYNDTTYSIKLISTSEFGCIDSLTKNVTVYSKPKAVFNFNQNSGCTPFSFQTINNSFSKNNLGLTHEWDFAGTKQSFAENDSMTFENSGDNNLTFDINYIATSFHGCKDSLSKMVTVYPKPKIDFNVSSKKTCSPGVIIANDLSINSYKHYWGYSPSQLNEDNASISFNLAGSYLYDTIYKIYHQVESNYGCLSDITFEEITLLGKPIAAFDVPKDSICHTQDLLIRNNSLGAVSYNWNFGNGNFSTRVNPPLKYNLNPSTMQDQSFKIQLIVNSVASCKDTIEKDVYIVNQPLDKVLLDKSFGCSELEVNFKNPSDRFKTVRWNFGDFSPMSYDDSVTHIYNNFYENIPIQYPVILTRNRYNCNDSLRTTVTVWPLPKANFNIYRPDVCDEGLHQFFNATKNLVNSLWSINNSMYYEQENLEAVLKYSIYNDTGYLIRLKVINNYGCMDSAEKVITLKPKMNIKYTKDPIIACENGTVTFTNQSTNAVRFFWSFGDGGFSNEKNPRYIYNNYGSYRISLYGYDENGCIDSITNNDYQKIIERPKADFKYLPETPKLPNALVNFIGIPFTRSSNNSNLKYEWNFGDNSPITSNNFIKDSSHLFKESGYFNVTLTISNENCPHTISKSIYIDISKPKADFETDTTFGCAPFTVNFKNNSEFTGSYIWYFGDGTTSTEKDPKHVYKFGGVYDVTLITTGLGGVDKISKFKHITVFEQPEADFYISKTFLNIPNAVFKAINTTQNIVSSRWTVIDSLGNDIQSSILRDPSFAINQVGRFDVQLIVSNSNGCVDTSFKSNYIRTEQPGYIYVANGFSPNKNNVNDNFKPSLFNVKPDNYIFRVYNRWGEKIFETFDLEGEWDGQYNDQLCPQETYVWTVEGIFESNETFYQRGTVSLLR